MSQSEVFRPSNGDLIARPGPVGEGFMASVDSFRKLGSRPSTNGGYRFGQLSQNSFFTRHNPHPNRVRHIKGLLDVPICAVNDNGYFSSPKYSLQFPPNAFNNNKMNNHGKVPVNAINVNSQLHPINTVTGLQYFTGLQSYPWREKAIPKVGMVPVTEAWRDELQQLTRILMGEEQQQKPKAPAIPREPERPRTLYSAETGRLIPPPSRAMSRGASRRASRQGAREPLLRHIAAEPDMESMVLSMLCQILQTEDINAVQAWLCSAGEREKTMVMDMIKAAMGNRETYYKHDYNPEFADEQRTVLPPIGDSQRQTMPGDMEKTIDRLILEDHGVPGEPQMESLVPKAQTKPVISDQEEFEFMPDVLGFQEVGDLTTNIRPPVSEAFKKQFTRPPTNAGRRTPSKTEAPPAPATSFRFTTSAQGKRENAAGAAEQSKPEAPAEQQRGEVTSPNTF
ncbi:protein TBATA-like isoform X1 [Argopecten irradians]|uniref:protein TBATA-like isoform X1 n=1 Tax=Argopecten irradians TaxID=31199 RepID=UPI003723ED87